MDEIKAGSTVTLKSGGPAMTVHSVSKLDTRYPDAPLLAKVSWAMPDGSVSKDEFPLHVLKLMPAS